MESIKYAGEHVIYGHIGHGLVVISFIAFIFSAFSYFKSFKAHDIDQLSWVKLGRSFFYVGSFSSIAILATLLFLMVSKYYEFYYVWFHVNDELPLKYIFSAFWEGQEGSFLLWIFWHSILGLVLLASAGKWESKTLPILGLVQAFLLLMILGVYLPGSETKIGSSPFVLLRHEMVAPLFSNPNYLSLVEGKGMNVLLQNYWMTIHPPTLFLGFASVTIPFLFVMAGLMSGDHKAWLRPAFPWALFSAGILGLGILMGSAWAYEALSFNGYWAWDPVENMSLVPWIVMIAGIHTHLIANATGRAIKSSYLFYGLSFLLVLYSTFLTRSGILGDSSAHAFTEMGLEWQLIIFLGFFTILFLYYYFKSGKTIPIIAGEEKVYSREFWMYIGSILLIFSSILISFTTSIPVYNSILDGIGKVINQDFISWHRATPLDPIGHYNKFQIWIAIFVAILSSFTYYLHYKERHWKTNQSFFIKQMGFVLLVSIFLTVMTSFWIDLHSWPFYLLAITGWATVVANLGYLIRNSRKHIKATGSLIAHAGFGLMLIGLLGSGLNKQFISTNPFTQRGLISDEALDKNIFLLKNKPMPMKGYVVTYKSDTIIDNNRTYTLSFEPLDQKGNTGPGFELFPNIVYERDFSKISASNPSTQRSLTRDIYAHIASIAPEEINVEQAKAKEDSLKYQVYNVRSGAAIDLNQSTVQIGEVIFNPKSTNYKAEPSDIAIGLQLKLEDKKSKKTYDVMPIAVLRGDVVFNVPAQVNELATKININKDVFESVFKSASSNTKHVKLSPGETVEIAGEEITFKAFKKLNESNQLAVGAELVNKQDSLLGMPIFSVEANSIKSERIFLPQIGAFAAFTAIDPKTNLATFEFNALNKNLNAIPLSIAQNSTRTDYIVLEAMEFPGINFFWGGSLLMMIGLFMSALYRRSINRKKHVSTYH